MNWLPFVLQVLSGLGGLGAVFLGIRSLYFLRVEHRAKRVDLSTSQQSAALALMSAQSPEVERLNRRLAAQDEYITDLEDRLRETRKRLLEVQMFADSLQSKYEQVDSQLTQAQMEIQRLRSREA